MVVQRDERSHELEVAGSVAGDIVHVDGRHLGRHDGIINYTVGQRRGLGIATGEPLYVVALDALRRRVIVGPHACLHTRRIVLRDLNWLGHDLSEGIVGDREIHVRIRSTQAPRAATLSSTEDATCVTLRDGEHGVAAGQACVFYADGSQRARVLGGGFIAAARLDQASPADRHSSSSLLTPR